MDKKIEVVIERIIKNFDESKFIMKFFKRFLDDLFFIFVGSTKMVHILLENVNKIHKNIKFTLKHTSIVGEANPCDCEFSESISFLDTSLVIKNSEYSESISVLDTRLVNSDTSLVIKNSEFSESISVLDTSLVIKNSEIIVDLYKKNLLTETSIFYQVVVIAHT